MTGSPVDYIIVIIYFAGILAFGSYFGRRTKSTKDFFFAGQRFSWWLIAASLVATGIGSYSFLKYAQAGYVRGMSSTMTYLNDWLIIPFFMFGWLPIIYFSRIKSIPEYFKRRFDSRTRVLATVFTLLYLIGYIGLNFYLLGTAMRALLGIPLMTSVYIVAIISAIYVTAGGQTAVIFTDLIQGVFLYIAGFILLVLGFGYLGGFGEWWGNLDLLHRLPFPAFNRPHDFNFISTFWGEGVIGTLAFTFINQGFIMRYLAVKNVNEGRKCLTFNTLLLMPISAIVVGNVGWMAASALSKGMIDPADNFNTKDIFIYFANIITMPGIFGFVIAALTAALMSTVDTLINACTAIGIYDIYKPYIRKEAPDKHYLLSARVLSVLVTFIGVLLVPIFANVKSIFAAHYAFVAMVTPPMLVAIFLGAIWPRFTAKAAFWSMIIGGLVILVSTPAIKPSLIKPIADIFNIDDGKTLVMEWQSGDNGMRINDFRRGVKDKIEGTSTETLRLRYSRTKPYSSPDAFETARIHTWDSDGDQFFGVLLPKPDGEKIYFRVGKDGYGRYSREGTLTVPGSAGEDLAIAWQVDGELNFPVNVIIADSIPVSKSFMVNGFFQYDVRNPYEGSAPALMYTYIHKGEEMIEYAAVISGTQTMTKYYVSPINTMTGVFSWDISEKTGGDYKYFRGVLGLIACTIVGIIVTFFSKPKKRGELAGLTFWTIQDGKKIFKGGEPNEKAGKKIVLNIRVEGDADTISVSPNAMSEMNAQIGDLMYIADSRRYLGGLNSLHVRVGKPHNHDDDAIVISEELLEESNIKPKRRIRLEKVI